MKSRKLLLALMLVAAVIAAGCKSKSDRVEKQIQKGEALFAAGDYNGAEKVYTEATGTAPDETAAWMGLAAARLKLGNTRGATEAYQHVLEIDPAHTDARLQMARFRILEGDTQKAEALVRDVLAASPDDVPALFLLADIYSRNKRFTDARDVYGQLIEKAPQEVRAYIGMAQIQAYLGDLDKAESFLKQSITVRPEADVPRLMLFNLYTTQHNDEAAEETLRQAAVDNPGKSLWPIMSGRFYLSRKQNEKAEAAFLSAIEKDPESVTPYMVAGNFYAGTGNEKKALSMYRRALDLQPQNVTIRYLLAAFLLKTNDFDGAARQISEILDKHPDYLPARLLEIKSLIVRKMYDQALQQCDSLLQTHPAADGVYYLKGLAFIGKEDLDGAEASFGQAVTIAPQNINAAMMLSKLYVQQGRMEEAQQVNRQIFAALNKNANVDLILGNTNLQAGNQQQSIESVEALSAFASADPFSANAQQEHAAALQDQYGKLIDELEAVLATDPTLIGLFENIVVLHAARNEYDVALKKCDRQLERVGASSDLAAAIYNIKGGLLLAQGKFNDARQAFETAIKTNPDFLKPYYGLARLYIMEKNMDMAISQYQAILARNPRQAGPHVLLGALYKIKRDYKQAEANYRKALVIKADSLQALNNLAYLLAEDGHKTDEALSLALKAKSIAPEDPFVRDTLGWIYYKMGLYEDAVRELKVCVDALPGNATANYHLGMAYYKKGNPGEARAHLKKALSLDGEFEGVATAGATLSEIQSKNKTATPGEPADGVGSVE